MKVEQRLRALQLRQQGLSYRQIRRQVRVSKSTLSLWLRHVALTPEQRARIDLRSFAARRKMDAYNRRKHTMAVLQHRTWHAEGRADRVTLDQRLLKWIGVGLYWAEGAKGRKGGSAEFANSDPRMIRLMMRWFREVCRVPEEKFRIRVQLHPGQSVEKALAMWSRVTRVPLRRFNRPSIKTSVTSRGKRGNILPCGVATIRIPSTELFHRIQGWIDALSGAPSSSGRGRVLLKDQTGVRLPVGPLYVREGLPVPGGDEDGMPSILRDRAFSNDLHLLSERV